MASIAAIRQKSGAEKAKRQRPVDRNDLKVTSGKSLLVMGTNLLRNARLNKGTGFSLEERQLYAIHGRLPPVVHSAELQGKLVLHALGKLKDDFARYDLLMDLHDSNEKLFFMLLQDHLDLLMPIVYTPTVATACLRYGELALRTSGLFITIYDLGNVFNILQNWPEKEVKAICVTDGERILGLGDQGVHGMPIPVGKLCLYSACGGVNPRWCLPVILDVGTNNEALLKDPLYLGLRIKRVRGKEYDDLVDEFMTSCVRRFGQQILIQFEDFGNENAFRLLEKYKDKYCTFNDDIQGTAAVTLAALFVAMRVVAKRLSDQRFLFLGAGEASVGIANLLILALKDEGIVKQDDAAARIWMFDSKGLLVKDRKDGPIPSEKQLFARTGNEILSFIEAIKEIKPTVLIGAAGKVGLFTADVIKEMGVINQRPIIFALSNPTSQSECTAEEAITLTEGRCLFASGSPFQPVSYENKTYACSQCNNCYIFPGMGLATVACCFKKIPDILFLKAADSLASTVTDQHVAEGRLLPPVSSIREISVRVATNVAEHAYSKNVATFYPEPQDKEKFIRSQLYVAQYETAMPLLYSWPEGAGGPQSQPEPSPSTGSRSPSTPILLNNRSL